MLQSLHSNWYKLSCALQDTQQAGATTDVKDEVQATANGSSEQQSAPAMDAQATGTSHCSTTPPTGAHAASPGNTPFFFSLMQPQRAGQAGMLQAQQPGAQQAAPQQQQFVPQDSSAGTHGPMGQPCAGGANSAFAPAPALAAGPSAAAAGSALEPAAGAAASAAAPVQGASGQDGMLASMASMPPAVQYLIAQNAAWLYQQHVQGTLPPGSTDAQVGPSQQAGDASAAAGPATYTPQLAGGAANGMTDASPSTSKTSHAHQVRVCYCLCAALQPLVIIHCMGGALCARIYIVLCESAVCSGALPQALPWHKLRFIYSM